MARKSGEIVLVKVDLLPTYPPAFQDYVQRYFERKTIFGIDCFYAFLDLHGHSVHSWKQTGVAPSQSGWVKVSEDVDLCNWLDIMCADKQQDGIVRLRKTWDDGCIEPDAD